MSWSTQRSRIFWITAVLLLLIAVFSVILRLPLTTRQGINYEVTAYSIPAYVKALDFLQRHHQYRLLVSRICSGKTSDVECVLAIHDWTHERIPLTPEGWTVVDDHVTNIIIRGHGTRDQIADVFVTLTGYAGVPAQLRWITHPTGRGALIVAFARLNDKWVMFDVQRHLVFRNRAGTLADIHELVADPELVDAEAHNIRIKGHPYSSFITEATLLPFRVSRPSRAEMQQPWARLRYEARRAVGLE